MDIRCHEYHSLLYLQIARSDTWRPSWTVCLVIADVHCNISTRVFAGVYGLIYTHHPRGCSSGMYLPDHTQDRHLTSVHCEYILWSAL